MFSNQVLMGTSQNGSKSTVLHTRANIWWGAFGLTFENVWLLLTDHIDKKKKTLYCT